MYHHHFHLLHYNTRQWPAMLLRYTHSAEANICKYSPEQPSSAISGGSLSLMTLMRSPLPACNFQSPFAAQVMLNSPKKITVMARKKTTVYKSLLMMSPKQGPGHSCL